MFEKFAARKANAIGSTKEFLEIKGQKYQQETNLAPIHHANDMIAFKCTHYSCTESCGTVKLTVCKKNKHQDVTFGIRTVDGTAKASTEYAQYDNGQIMLRAKKDDEFTFEVQIFDNQDFQPDLEFHCELYDVKTKDKLYGDDTTCKITILDEDFPGTLQF